MGKEMSHEFCRMGCGRILNMQEMNHGGICEECDKEIAQRIIKEHIGEDDNRKTERP